MCHNWMCRVAVCLWKHSAQTSEVEVYSGGWQCVYKLFFCEPPKMWYQLDTWYFAVQRFGGAGFVKHPLRRSSETVLRETPARRLAECRSFIPHLFFLFSLGRNSSSRNGLRNPPSTPSLRAGTCGLLEPQLKALQWDCSWLLCGNRMQLVITTIAQLALDCLDRIPCKSQLLQTALIFCSHRAAWSHTVGVWCLLCWGTRCRRWHFSNLSCQNVILPLIH